MKKDITTKNTNTGHERTHQRQTFGIALEADGRIVVGGFFLRDGTRKEPFVGGIDLALTSFSQHRDGT
jgi:hypothetical protein